MATGRRTATLAAGLVLLLASGVQDAAWAEDYAAGVEALRAGRIEQARQALERAVATAPERADAWWELGWAHWRARDLEQARRAWRRVKRLQPGRAELDHWLGAVETKLELRAVATGPVAVPLRPAGKRFTLAAAGDTMLGTDLRRGPRGLAKGDGERLLAPVAGLLRRADVAFVNLEGTLADDLPQTKCGPDSRSCYAFRTPTRYTAALRAAGIDVVSCANNHAMDLGVAGMESTMRALDAAGIAHAGRYGDVARLQHDGVRLVLVAAHSGACCPNVNAVDEVTAAVRLADREADVVVLSMHAGAEGARHRHVPGKLERAYGEARGDVRRLARAAVDAGADLVLGHGPHVLRAMEVYRGRLIAYSLGNFIGYKQFGTRGGYGGTSLILEVELAANGVLVGARLHPLALDRRSVPQPDPRRRALRQVRRLSLADFPASGVRVGRDGALDWKRPAAGEAAADGAD